MSEGTQEGIEIEICVIAFSEVIQHLIDGLVGDGRFGIGRIFDTGNLIELIDYHNSLRDGETKYPEVFFLMAEPGNTRATGVIFNLLNVFGVPIFEFYNNFENGLEDVPEEIHKKLRPGKKAK